MESLYAQFQKVVKKYPHFVALRFEKKKWTYKATDEKILEAARKLLQLGIRKGEVLTVALPNCPTAIFLFYAINRIGAISYNIHPLTPPSSVRKMMENVGSKRLVCLSLNASENKKAIGEGISIIAVNPYFDASFIKRFAVKRMSKMGDGIIPYEKIKESPSLPQVKIAKEDDAVFLNTGGTSGEPKVVRLSNGAINHVGANSYQLIGGPFQSIRILTAIPLFHVFGLEMGVHTPLSFGGTSVLMLKFNTKEAIGHIKSGRSTVILGVPSLYNALLSRKAFYGPHLKKQITAFIGGDSVPQSLLDRWNNAMEENGSEARLYQGYGLTEAGVVVVSTKGRAKKGSIGTPLPGVKVKILDVESRKEAPNGINGEIALAGPTIMSGYLNSPKENEESFLEIEGERYFLTKDYGYRDKDGYDFFKQRLRRIVKINGETLCPSEVEDVVLKLDDVFDAFCYGVKNDRKGAAFRLIVSKRKGDVHRSDEDVLAEIKEAVANELPPSYMPEKIFMIDHLPRTPIGKVDMATIEKERRYFD